MVVSFGAGRRTWRQKLLSLRQLELVVNALKPLDISISTTPRDLNPGKEVEPDYCVTTRFIYFPALGKASD